MTTMMTQVARLEVLSIGRGERLHGSGLYSIIAGIPASSVSAKLNSIDPHIDILCLTSSMFPGLSYIQHMHVHLYHHFLSSNSPQMSLS